MVGSGAMGRQVEVGRFGGVVNAAFTDAGLVVLVAVEPVVVVSFGAPFGIVVA